jgi:hypothetical protein
MFHLAEAELAASEMVMVALAVSDDDPRLRYM